MTYLCARGPHNRSHLVYSDCGYDHREAGTKKRRTAVNFMGCLAHAEVTFVVETQQILHLRGYFEHNTECKAALLARIPPLPLHPLVHQQALSDLARGVSLSDIQRKNQEWVRGMVMDMFREMPRVGNTAF